MPRLVCVGYENVFVSDAYLEPSGGCIELFIVAVDSLVLYDCIVLIVPSEGFVTFVLTVVNSDAKEFMKVDIAVITVDEVVDFREFLYIEVAFAVADVLVKFSVELECSNSREEPCRVCVENDGKMVLMEKTGDVESLEAIVTVSVEFSRVEDIVTSDLLEDVSNHVFIDVEVDCTDFK